MEINFKLPMIDLNLIKEKYEISKQEEEIILGIMYDVVGGVGILRATRPKNSGINSWVWRNIMMLASPEEKFHTVATALDAYIDDYPNKQSLEPMLNALVDKIASTIAPEFMYGMNSWKDASGVK